MAAIVFSPQYNTISTECTHQMSYPLQAVWVFYLMQAYIPKGLQGFSCL